MSTGTGPSAPRDENLSPHAWLVHEGVSANDFDVHLDGAAVWVPGPAPATLVVASGRADCSAVRVRHAYVQALRDAGVAPDTFAIDLSDTAVRFVLVDELAMLVATFDDVVRPLAGRRPGLYLPARLSRRVAAVARSNPYASNRLSAATGPSPPTPATASRPDALPHPRLTARPDEAAERCARTTVAASRPAWRRRLPWVTAASVVVIPILTYAVSGSIRSTFLQAAWIPLLWVVVYQSLESAEDVATEKELERVRSAFTRRFRDRANGRLGTFLGSGHRTRVRWSDEPELVDELTSATSARVEYLDPDLVVDADAGREGRQIDRVRRLLVRYDGEHGDIEHALAEARLDDLEPLPVREPDGVPVPSDER